MRAMTASGHKDGRDATCKLLPVVARLFNVNSLNMSWKKRAERAYHHGNLREALIQAARDLIKEKGPAGFTFADAARSAGVSPAAPYRHFRDRDALVAVAMNGEPT